MKKAIFILSSCLLFTCCDAKKEGEIIVKPHDYSEIEHLKINWFDSLKQIGTYLIYYFGDHCSHCHEIKNEVITYALEGKTKIYFCNDSNIVYFNGDLAETIGKTDINEVYINGTPSVIEVKEKTIIDNVCGANKVLKKIRGE